MYVLSIDFVNRILELMTWRLTVPAPLRGGYPVFVPGFSCLRAELTVQAVVGSVVKLCVPFLSYLNSLYLSPSSFFTLRVWRCRRSILP